MVLHYFGMSEANQEQKNESAVSPDLLKNPEIHPLLQEIKKLNEGIKKLNENLEKMQESNKKKDEDGFDLRKYCTYPTRIPREVLEEIFKDDDDEEDE